MKEDKIVNEIEKNAGRSNFEATLKSFVKWERGRVLCHLTLAHFPLPANV